MRPLVALLALAVACSADPADQRAMCPPRTNAALLEVDGGACVYGCVAGWATCGDGGACTTNILTDPQNCRGCGMRCLEGQRCDERLGCMR